MRIGIIDYNAGNPVSVMNALTKIGVTSFISSDPSVLKQADKLILPGVGAFDNAKIKLDNSGITEMLQKKVMTEHTPFLGICLGMQLMTISSEEGNGKGFGWLNTHTVRFKNDNGHKTPHTGWDYTKVCKGSKLFQRINGEMKFYFTHSFHVVCDNEEDVLCTTDYGATFVSAIEKDNIAGVQFHPEKSGRYGSMVLKNFAEFF